MVYRGDNNDPEKKEILFFDDIGFGWIVPKYVIEPIYGVDGNEKVKEMTLADLLR